MLSTLIYTFFVFNLTDIFSAINFNGRYLHVFFFSRPLILYFDALRVKEHFYFRCDSIPFTCPHQLPNHQLLNTVSECASLCLSLPEMTVLDLVYVRLYITADSCLWCTIAHSKQDYLVDLPHAASAPNVLGFFFPKVDDLLRARPTISGLNVHTRRRFYLREESCLQLHSSSRRVFLVL